MKIYLATDHAGFELKELVKRFLQEVGHDVVDCGATSFDPDDDYPDFVATAAGRLSSDLSVEARGVVFGKSGAGEAIVANKFRGIRAVLGFCRENVALARAHNDANVLSLGSGFVDPELAKTLVRLFLETPFSYDMRHVRRIERIKAIEGARS